MEATVPSRSISWRDRFLAFLLTTSIVLGFSATMQSGWLPGLAGQVIGAQSASAAAYTIGVYSPNRINPSQIQGWANLSRDCSGTYGCYNYIKIERTRAWGIEHVGGWWANAHGWNSITVNLPAGCHDYRTTVDSYNDVAGGYGSGVNIGPVGTSKNGTKINRFRTTWSSGFARHCR